MFPGERQTPGPSRGPLWSGCPTPGVRGGIAAAGPGQRGKGLFSQVSSGAHGEAGSPGAPTVATGQVKRCVPFRGPPRASRKLILGGKQHLCELFQELSFWAQQCRNLQSQTGELRSLGEAEARGRGPRGKPSLTPFHFDFLLCFPVPNQMHYHIFSSITISGGNSFFLIQLKDWQLVSYKWLRVTLTKIVIVIDVMLT